MSYSAVNRRSAIAGACSLALVIFLCGIAFAQQFVPATAANAKQFVGTWQGSFQGKAFITVTIGFEGNKLVGTASHADIEVGKDGELTKAEPGDGADPITDARVKGDVLRITTKSPDGQDSFESNLRLVANNELSMQIVIPPDVPAPAPKAWRLERVAAKP
jgi:hypothetical protein